MIGVAVALDSTKMQDSAPLLRDSIPSDPEPANKSRTAAPMTRLPRLENIASLTRSVVGRVRVLGTLSGRLPALPAIILMEKQTWGDYAKVFMSPIVNIGVSTYPRFFLLEKGDRIEDNSKLR